MSLFAYQSDGDETASAEHRILDSLTEADWKRLLTHVEQLTFQAGDYLIRAGDVDRSLFILISGTATVIVDTPEGERSLATYSEGSVIGEIALFDGAPRSAHVRTETPGSAVRVSRDKFEYLSAWEPEIARTLLIDLGTVLALRLRDTTRELNALTR